jgi:hypothetical protein
LRCRCPEVPDVEGGSASDTPCVLQTRLAVRAHVEASHTQLIAKPSCEQRVWSGAQPLATPVVPVGNGHEIDPHA